MPKPKQPPKYPPESSITAGARHAVDYTVRRATGQKSTGADRFRSRQKNVTGQGKPAYRRTSSPSTGPGSTRGK